MARSRRRKLGRDEKFILDVLVALVVLLVGIRYLPGAWLISFEWLTGNQVARIGFALLALLFALFNYLRKRPLTGSIALVPMLVVLIELAVHLPFHRHVDLPLGTATARILTFNAGTRPIASSLTGIQNSGADIVCLQEVYVAGLEDFLVKAGESGYESRFVLLRDDAGMGTVILSRESITVTDTLFTSSWNEKIRRFAQVQTSVDGIPIRVVSLQLESTNRKQDLYGVIESWKLRLEQAERVRDAIIGGSLPIVVAGDLNSTPTNRAIRPLLRAFNDSWRASGFGVGGTWHHRFPLFRIDYVLYSGFEGAANPEIFHMGESDHLAYQVDLLLPAGRVENSEGLPTSP